MERGNEQDERNNRAQWPRDTPQYTFVFRALHSLGRQMFGEEWPQDEVHIFDNANLNAVVENLQQMCESGQCWATIQLPITGQMFHLTRDAMTTNAFRDAIVAGKIEVAAEAILAEDFRPLNRLIGTRQWLFIEDAAPRIQPTRFDGILIDEDPMQMPLWSIGMAMVWIAYRSPGKMREICSTPLEVLLLSYGDGTPAEVIAARHALLGALATGAIAATGRPASGRRREIDNLEWADLQLFFDDREAGLEYRAFGQERDGSGRPRDASYCDLRIERNQVTNHVWRQPSDRISPTEDKLRVQPVLQTTSIMEVEVPMAPKPIRQAPQRTRATKAIEALFPNGVPDRTEMRDGHLTKVVADKIGTDAPSRETILRAAGRKG